MKNSLIRREDITIKSWINNKTITTSDWEVFSVEEGGGDDIIILVKEPKTNNQLRINITKYTKYTKNENFEEIITE